MVKAYLVLRMKGQVNIPYWAKTTLKLLRLDKKLLWQMPESQIQEL